MRKKLFTASAVAIASLLLILFLQLCAPRIQEAVSDSTLQGTNKKPIQTVCIADLSDCGFLRYVNYTPDVYLKPGFDFSGDIIDLTQPHTLASKGTLEFILLNIDPRDEKFDEKKEKLSPYLGGDNHWHFTLFLPPCLSACNVYVRSLLNSRVGNLSDYDFVKYTDSNYSGKTEAHKDTTEPLFLDLDFYTRREAMGSMLQQRAVAVTIHYETKDGRPAGFTGLPLIGSDTGIREQFSSGRTLLTVLALLSVVMTAVFAFVCALKKTVSFLPQTLVTAGIVGWTETQILLSGATQAPYFLSALGHISFSLIVTASFFIKKYYVRKFPLWLPAALLSAVQCLFSLISVYRTLPFVPTVNTVIHCLLAGYLLIIVTASLAFDRTKEIPLIQLLTAFLLLAAVFASPTQPPVFSPVTWMLALILAVTVITGIDFFIKQERRSVYLTNNLQSEVSRQTNDLQAIITEREKLLRYLSHDLKKPVQSVKKFLLQLEKPENQDQQQFALCAVRQKVEIIDSSLSDLQKYSQMNYTAEASAVYDIYDILSEIFEDLNPDCIANNTVLACHTDHIRIFAKKKTLLMILNNLVFNALEHSSCTQIDIHAVKVKTMCHITVTDNGKGLPLEQDPFRPYYSESDLTENLGLGLYICRQYAGSMGGELSHKRIDQKTVFTVTVPIT